MSVIEKVGDARSLSARAMLVPLFTAPLFCSAFLLFSVQPMFAKMLLPKLGGSASVWSVIMVFFQAALLAGYGYAHFLATRCSPARARLLHFLTLAVALSVLPISLPSMANSPSSDHPELWLLGLCAVGVGLPFFALSTNAPLLQVWFSKTRHDHAENPYFLYAASNMGSFAALLSYPFLIEPNISSSLQSVLWSGLFVIVIFLLLPAAFLATHSGRQEGTMCAMGARSEGKAPSTSDKLRWMGLAFVPSGLLVAVTAHISADVAAAPLLWIAPLALFLFSIIVTFQRNPVLSHEKMLAFQPVSMALAVFVLATSMTRPLPIIVAVNLLAFFVGAMVCHGELARRRPDSRYLTEFYLSMSLGGVLGGAAAALLAPNVFSSVLEYPLLMGGAILCRPGLWTTDRRSAIVDACFAASLTLALAALYMTGAFSSSYRLLAITLAAGFLLVQHSHDLRFLLCFFVLGAGPFFRFEAPEARFRNFYGVLGVSSTEDGRFRHLFHGTTIHGTERVKNDDGTPFTGRPIPLGYYGYESPMGEAIRAARAGHGGSIGSVGIIGLGVGSLACHRLDGERWTFFEINPEVVTIASDPKWFRSLSVCAPEHGLLLGDARLTLEKQKDARFGIIVVDAFSSDSIPVHLLTRQAIETYFASLDEKGFVTFHLSNRHMDLTNIVAATASASGYVTFVKKHAVGEALQEQGFAPSIVAVVARSPSDIAQLADDPTWRRLVPAADVRAWTDDYSNVLAAIWDRYVGPAGRASAE